MNLEIRHGLPFVSIEVGYRTSSTVISAVLVDTGSASTILSIDLLGSIGVFPEPEDPIRTIRGVGGVEVVFQKRLDYLILNGSRISNITAEVGAMDYGFEINGIIGMDLLRKTGSVLDLGKLQFSLLADNNA
jgi:predicted aspartyl protease